VLRARTSLSRAALVVALVLWASPTTAANPTIGGACTTGDSAAATTGDGNNLVCIGSVWQYPAYQFGASSASCNATNAGITRYNSGVEQYCNGSVWITFPGLVLISTQTASNSASLQWTGLGSTYNIYKLYCNGMLPVNDANLLYLNVGEGGTPTWETSNGSYANRRDESASSNATVQITNTANGLGLTGSDVSNLAGDPGTVDVTIYNVPSPSLYKDIVMYDGYRPTSGGFAYVVGGGYWNGDTNAITAIRVLYTSGNISEGTCSLYGLNQ
jgi:hypothetical protein